jgi:hypothetical protein
MRVGRLPKCTSLPRSSTRRSCSGSPGDVDKARAEAEEVAHKAEEAIEGIAEVETDVGDANLVLAIDDALATFPADEVIVVTRRGSNAKWLEQDGMRETQQRLGLPLTHRVVDG